MKKKRLMKLICAMCCILLACALTACESSENLNAESGNGSAVEEAQEETPEVEGSNSADIVDSGACGDDLTWTLDENGVLTIFGTGAMDQYTYEYDTDTQSWFTSAPWESYEISSVVIEAGVTSIGGYAFMYCTGMAIVIIPDNVTSIGECAFAGCTGLTSVTIPDSVTSIGEYAFAGCTGLTDVYYAGSESDWAAITIDEDNDYLTSAALHCNSAGSE